MEKSILCSELKDIISTLTQKFNTRTLENDKNKRETRWSQGIR
jgi:hypothetical protein